MTFQSQAVHECKIGHILFDDVSLKILDQRMLPQKEIYIRIEGVDDGFNAIKNMAVRGAPCIAIVGLLSLSVELASVKSLIEEEKLTRNNDSLYQYLDNSCKKLCESRPTAVNLRNECCRLLKTVEQHREDTSFDELVDLTKKHIKSIMFQDISINRAIGSYGAQHLIDNHLLRGKKAVILTHCNTGSLATAGYGTALGVIRALHERQKLDTAYCTETRPYNQGSRLTAYELTRENIPCKLICDNMAAAVMSMKHVDAVIVGADRVALNGDTANKIGTYGLAVIAKHHNVPFFIALPSPTFDSLKKNGSEIVIEERPSEEVKTIAGHFIAPTEVECWNPSFDITPAGLITGYITEYGVFKAEDLPEKLSGK
ncbi:methylthioribose-1-phosphate isomerase [Brevipalpus obovatus]|uniref:methylthioribose-1-phosphate isomerase n=1 Tax=Brevipalpus obovatus TaxID=246614 RepID=UPI003D9F69B1